MNVKIIRVSDGQEIDIKQLDKQFAGQYLSENPFGLIITATLGLLQDAIRPDFTEEESLKEAVAEQPDLFSQVETPIADFTKIEEKSSCTGNPGNCPVCSDEAPAEYFSDFSEALSEMKEGEHVTRKAWLVQGANGHIELVEENDIHDSFIAYYDNDTNKYVPYVLTNDDLLAEDWLLIKKEN